jgi:hypothetical protein
MTVTGWSAARTGVTGSENEAAKTAVAKNKKRIFIKSPI